METTKTWISQEQMSIMYELFNQEPVIRVARNLIHNTLFSGGLEVECKGKKISKAFNEVLSKHWIPFAGEVLDHILMFGFCPFVTTQIKVKTDKKENNGKAVVPLIPPFGSYKIELRMTPDFQQTLHLYPITNFPNVDDSENEKVQFLTVPKFFPSLTGILRSQLAPLVYSFRNSRLLMELALHAEHLRTHPTLFTQSNKDGNKTDAVAMEMFADGDAYMSRDEAQYAKNKERMNDFYRQQNMAAVLNGKHTKNHNVSIDPLTGKPIVHKHKQVWEDNVFVLPEGQQMAPGINPQARTDFLDMERLRYDLICGVMGVPKGLVLPDRSSGMGSAGVGDITYRIFMRTMEGLRFMLCGLLGQVYEQVYGDENCQLTLPFLPLTSVDDIIKVSDQYIMNRKEAGIQMLRALGLSDSILDLQPLPVETPNSGNSERPAKKQKKSI